MLLELPKLLQLTPPALAAEARAVRKLLDDVTLLGQLEAEHEPPAAAQAELHDWPWLPTYHESAGATERLVKWPAEQVVQFSAAARALYLPATQSMHVFEFVSGLYLPALHLSQELAPTYAPLDAWMVTVPLCPLLISVSPPKAQTSPPL